MVGCRELWRQAKDWAGIELSPAQCEAFDWYQTTLMEWNERFNLTAITAPDEIEIKHFLDSLTCLLVMEKNPTGKLIDVGSGAGFPGLPLKIAVPSLQVTLVESVGKKADFCQHVVDKLELGEVEVINARAEEIGQVADHRGAYDWAVARAVAAMPVLVEYLLPLLKLGGKAVIQKGETGPAETHHADTAIQLLGGKVEQVRRLDLPRVVEARYLIVIKKLAATPEKYPRRPGMPSKRPLA
ncbi:MAG: 16S rRNA (guanine(527)-N(7))-methyltransferase RsmG [Anaerolineales bacterium]|jgi:16S rRNA (guanine527-N7)-methyltransferase